MREDPPNPQINVSKIPGGGGVAGALFAVISMAIFSSVFPLLRFMFPAAIVLGCAIALIRHFIRRETDQRIVDSSRGRGSNALAHHEQTRFGPPSKNISADVPDPRVT